MASIRAMVDECPRTKALRDFLAAGSSDSNQKWAEYVALCPDLAGSLNRLHGPAVVPASTPMRSTASPRALSSAVSTDNFPGAATASLTSTPTMARSTAASVRAETSTRVPSAAPLDSTPTLVLSSSTATALTTTGTSRTVPCTKHDLTLEARHIYDYLVGATTVLPFHTEVEHVRDEVDIGVADLAVWAPATCSAECPSHDTSVYAAARILDASEVSTVLPEVSTVLREPTALNVASITVDTNAIGLADTVPTNSSSKCPNREVTVLVSDTISSAKLTSSMTTSTDPSELATAVAGDKALDLVAAGHTSSTVSLATISTGVIALHAEDNLVTAELQVGKDVFWTNHVPSRGLVCPVTASDLNLNIIQQEQLWCPPNRAFLWKLCANERPLSEEESSENSRVFLPWDTTQLQSWPPPPSLHAFVPALEKNPWIHSWIELLLFEHVCSLEVFFDSHITGTCLRHTYIDSSECWGVRLASALLLGFHCQSSSEYFGSPCVITREQTVNSVTHLCQDIPFMPRTILFHLHVESVERIRSRIGIELCWFSSLGAELLVICFVSLRILNLHGTLDNMQPSEACQVLKTMALKWSSVLIMIIFVPGVKKARLKSIVFKWTDQFCHDTNSSIASTSMDMLLDLLLARRDIGTLWTWCYIDNLHGSPGSTTLVIPDWKMFISSLERWVLLNCDFASAHFQWKITVQQSTSSGAFLAMSNGRADVQHQYTCARVLLVAARKGQISHHILQGNPDYTELLQWSFSHAQLQYGIRIYTARHILFFCCASVQQKIPWTIRHVSLKSWIHRCRAVRESLYGCKTFQWTIAWSLRYHLALSCPWLFSCPLLVKLVELKPWPSWVSFLCISVVNIYLRAAFHIVIRPDSVLMGIYSIPSHYLEVHIWAARIVRLSVAIILHVGKFYLLQRLYSSCNQPVTALLSAAGCHSVTSTKASTCALHLPAYVVIWGSCGMNLGQGKLSWDPGIRAPLWFFRFAARATQGWIMVEALTHCYSHYTVDFLDQALFNHDYYMNIVQFHSNHIYHNFHQHYEASNIKKSHMPWDPGGPFHRLGVKPIFMEGGLSATSLSTEHGPSGGLPTTGLWATTVHKRTTNIQERGHRRTGLERKDGTAASAEAGTGLEEALGPLLPPLL